MQGTPIDSQAIADFLSLALTCRPMKLMGADSWRPKLSFFFYNNPELIPEKDKYCYQ
jgi:hypothetical protein